MGGKDSKLQVFLDSGIVGQIVFEEDRLYYLVTPLFLQKAARAELQIEGVKKTNGRTDIEIVHLSAQKYKIPESVSRFFFFNPFSSLYLSLIHI